MIEISIEGKKYLLAESWQEITRKELMIIADLFTRFHSSGDFLKHALIRMLGIRKHLVPYDGQIAMARGLYRVLPFPCLIRRGIHKGRVKVFPQEDLFVLSQMLSWIHSSSPGFGNTLTKNLLPGITIGRFPFRKKVYGPDDHLKDVIGVEYARAENAFLSFCSTREQKYLDDLVAVLYRPRKRFLGLKRLFSDSVDSARMRYTGQRYGRYSAGAFSLRLDVKYAVFLFFQGCRNELLDRYAHVFTCEGGDGRESSGWAGIFRALTNESIIDIERVMELPIHTILFDLNEKIKLNHQQKSESNG